MKQDKQNEAVKTAKVLRGSFLNKAEKIMDLYLDDAINVTAENRTSSKESQKKIFDALIPMIQSAGDAHALELANTHDVIACLKDGTITFLEAKQLMDMLSVQSDIEDVKKLLMAVERLS